MIHLIALSTLLPLSSCDDIVEATVRICDITEGATIGSAKVRSGLSTLYTLLYKYTYYGAQLIVPSGELLVYSVKEPLEKTLSDKLSA